MLRTRMLWIMALAPFIFALQGAWAAQLTQPLPGELGRHFVFKTDDSGKLISVKMKLGVSGFSLRPLIEQVKRSFKQETLLMQNKSFYQKELDEFIGYLEENSNKSRDNAENIRLVRNSIENLPEVKIDSAFESIQEQGKGVLARFEEELKTALASLDLTIMAYPQDARFFYRKNVTHEVVKRALEFAQRRFDNVPLLNLISFVIVETHNLVLEQRTFYQNMLLHYLDHVSPEEMGLSVADADRLFSSIYESRISFMNLPESNRAADTWDRYGLNRFYGMVRAANNKLRRTSYRYDSVIERYNFGFVEVMENGERVVKNLIDNNHSFSFKSATAYNFDRPNLVKRNRALLTLADFGVGFLPIPGWIKAQVSDFLKSFHASQRLNEGALVAYFDLKGDR